MLPMHTVMMSANISARNFFIVLLLFLKSLILYAQVVRGFRHNSAYRAILYLHLSHRKLFFGYFSNIFSFFWIF